MVRNRSPAARIILIVAVVIAVVIAVAILLIVVDANQGNMIVNAVVEVGRFFTTPFHGMFPQDSRDLGVLINWGVGALAYLIVGALVARLVR